MSLTRSVYATKAEKYARYRWDYAPEAIDQIWRLCGLSQGSLVGDIGAGTGILTHHFAGRVNRVIALEPNLEMRVLAGKHLAGRAGCLVGAAAAEALPLPNHSLDLLTAGQALHWFEPTAARAEFRRVVKPEGWLAFVSNSGADVELGAALAGLQTGENGFDPNQPEPPGLHVPPDHYLSAAQVFSYPFIFQQDWDSFLGSLLSASFMPDEDHPRYPNLEQSARRIFERFSRAGRLEVKGVTRLTLGRPPS